MLVHAKDANLLVVTLHVIIVQDTLWSALLGPGGANKLGN
jgi:hypothetical protein